MGKFIDLTGQRFGRLTVTKRAPDKYTSGGNKKTMWYCDCDCGTKDHIVYGGSLRDESTLSCGCYGKEQRLKANVKHGLSHTRIKRIYYNMHSRCNNPNVPKYENHGGRGISVCNEWSGKDGLANFYNWAINNGYDENLTLDRIDNDGNYEPSNCRWADYMTQNRNLRTNRYFTINGETKIASDWCKEYNININTFWQRVIKGVEGENLLKSPEKYAGCNSGYPGIEWRADREKWRVTLCKDGQRYNLGTFADLNDAIAARLEGELKYFGEYVTDINNIKLKDEKEN